MSFSQRMGITPNSKELQIEHIDEELKNGLWNLIEVLYLEEISDSGLISDFEELIKIIWHDFFKERLSTTPNGYKSDKIKYLERRFFEFTWFRIYDFIEFLLDIYPNNDKKDEIFETFNHLLEREFSGYRIMDGKIVPISNQLEYDEIKETLDGTKYLTALNGTNIHLSKALDLLSDKQNPDYRNSIKESISAVEATARLITGENTLGKALNKLESKGLDVNSQLKSGFEKIYAYTNDKSSGIRHSIINVPKNPDFSDAKYMLVSCSSFINYLISKAKKIGMEF